jgi:2-dehydropantoate 2-reductase
MKIGVAGAGAMGCLIGGYLARAGEEVWLFSRSDDHVEALTRNGLRLTYRDHTHTIAVKATTRPPEAGPCDVVVVVTKHRHTREALENVRSTLDDRTLLVTLQNGIGNAEIISDFVDPGRILFGVTGLGAVKTGPGAITATVVDGVTTHVWSAAGNPSPPMTAFVEALVRSGFDVQLSPDVRQQIWQKLCVNAGFSALCAIVRLSVGDMLQVPAARDLIRSLVLEIAAVGRCEGVAIDGDEAFDRVWDLAERSPAHVPSFLVDVLNGRQTEVDCLNGAVVAKARKHGIEVPVNQAVTGLLAIIENAYDQRMPVSPG